GFMKKTLIILFIIGLIITIVCGIGVVNQFQVESKKSKEVTENYHKVYDNNAEVKKLNVDLSNSNIKLKRGDQLKVESRGTNDKINMDTTVKNGTLYVKDKPLDSNVDITFMDFKHNDVTITLPKSLSHLKVNTESGSIMVDQIKADYAKLYADLGKLKDRKSTRLNSSHVSISYAVFCLKKKKKKLTANYESYSIMEVTSA